MRRWSIIVGLCTCLLAGAASAQDPQITVTAEQEEVIVGQPYILRLEVLVPTFMPKQASENDRQRGYEKVWDMVLNDYGKG